jgi:hypothetical protein
MHLGSGGKEKRARWCSYYCVMQKEKKRGEKRSGRKSNEGATSHHAGRKTEGLPRGKKKNAQHCNMTFGDAGLGARIPASGRKEIQNGVTYLSIELCAVYSLHLTNTASSHP